MCQMYVSKLYIILFIVYVEKLYYDSKAKLLQRDDSLKNGVMILGSIKPWVARYGCLALTVERPFFMETLIHRRVGVM